MGRNKAFGAKAENKMIMVITKQVAGRPGEPNYSTTQHLEPDETRQQHTKNHIGSEGIESFFVFVLFHVTASHRCRYILLAHAYCSAEGA